MLTNKNKHIWNSPNSPIPVEFVYNGMFYYMNIYKPTLKLNLLFEVLCTVYACKLELT